MSVATPSTRPDPSLKAMAERKVPGVNKHTNFFVDPLLIQVRPGYNRRFMRPALREHIDSLKAVMRRGGRIPAIDVTVEDGVIYVEEGHCRLHAAVELIKLEGHQIKLEVRQFNGSPYERLAYMDTSSNGLRLIPLEQGILYSDMMSLEGASHADVAASVGRSEQHVRTMVQLAAFGPEVQQLLIDDKVRAHVVLNVLARFKGDLDKATKFLVASVRAAEASGDGRITNKSIAGPALPKRVIGSVVSSLDRIAATIPAETRSLLIKDIGKYTEEGTETAMVSLPVNCVASLLDMLAAVDEHKARLADRDARKQRKATKAAANAEPLGARTGVDPRQGSLLPDGDGEVAADSSLAVEA